MLTLYVFANQMLNLTFLYGGTLHVIHFYHHHATLHFGSRVMFRHKNHMVRVMKTLCSDLKYLLWSPSTRPEMPWLWVKNIQFFFVATKCHWNCPDVWNSGFTLKVWSVTWPLIPPLSSPPPPVHIFSHPLGCTIRYLENKKWIGKKVDDLGSIRILLCHVTGQAL